MSQRILILLLCSAVIAHAEADSDRDGTAAVRDAHRSAIQSAEGSGAELAALRLKIAETYEELNKENARLNQMQREYERKDPIARGLREKLVSVEKELVQLRQSLQSRLEAIEEIREIEVRRKEILVALQELKQQERVLQATAKDERALVSARENAP